jgi:DNA-binding NarL/FixJ family response regulator
MPGNSSAGTKKTNPGKEVIRIVLVDDHVILRDGLQSLLEMEPDFQIVGHAGGLDEALEVVRSLRPDLVITDIRLAGDSGLRLIPELKKLRPGTRTLILSAHCTDEYVRAALEAGADGYMLKEADREELAKGIRAVSAGEQFLCADVTTRLVSGFLDKDGGLSRRKASTLTDREQEVLTMIASAQSTKEIARALDLSVKTVEKHRSNLMNKLDLRSSAALTLYAVRNHYVSADLATDESDKL